MPHEALFRPTDARCEDSFQSQLLNEKPQSVLQKNNNMENKTNSCNAVVHDHSYYSSEDEGRLIIDIKQEPLDSNTQGDASNGEIINSCSQAGRGYQREEPIRGFQRGIHPTVVFDGLDTKSESAICLSSGVVQSPACIRDTQLTGNSLSEAASTIHGNSPSGTGLDPDKVMVPVKLVQCGNMNNFNSQQTVIYTNINNQTYVNNTGNHRVHVLPIASQSTSVRTGWKSVLMPKNNTMHVSKPTAVCNKSSTTQVKTNGLFQTIAQITKNSPLNVHPIKPLEIPVVANKPPEVPELVLKCDSTFQYDKKLNLTPFVMLTRIKEKQSQSEAPDSSNNEVQNNCQSESTEEIKISTSTDIGSKNSPEIHCVNSTMTKNTLSSDKTFFALEAIPEPETTLLQNVFSNLSAPPSGIKVESSPNAPADILSDPEWLDTPLVMDIKQELVEEQSYSQGYYMCDSCGEVFRSQELLLKHHESQHAVTTNFSKKPAYDECNVCGLMFSNPKTLHRHKETAHAAIVKLGTIQPPTKKLIFKCFVCSAKFGSLQETTTHLATSHSNALRVTKDVFSFSCGKCNKLFTSQSELQTHFKGCFTGFRCPRCSFWSQTRADLVVHEQINHPTTTCKICKLAFNDIDKYNVHKKHCKLYQCGQCKQEFYRAFKLQNHLDTHLGKRYRCSTCKVLFFTMFDLSRHRYCEHYTIIGTRYRCNFCSKEFCLLKDLENHIMYHVKDKRFKCDVCQNFFYTKQYLEKHKTIHTGEKPHECGICHKRFRIKDNMNFHMRTHTGERPYKCSLCDGTFTSSSALGTHYRRHTGEKRHKCHLCRKAFIEKPVLTRHIRSVHMRERNFHCKICDKGFFDQDKLKRHVIDVHETKGSKKKAACVHCGKVFSNRHRRDKHSRYQCKKPKANRVKRIKVSKEKVKIENPVSVE